MVDQLTDTDTRHIILRWQPGWWSRGRTITFWRHSAQGDQQITFHRPSHGHWTVRDRHIVDARVNRELDRLSNR